MIGLCISVVLLVLRRVEMGKTRGGCKLYSVPCDDNDGCYSISDVCDGVKRCTDGTDEVQFSVVFNRSRLLSDLCRIFTTFSL